MQYKVKRGCEDLVIFGLVDGKMVNGLLYGNMTQKQLEYLYGTGNEFIDAFPDEPKAETRQPGPDAKK